MSDEKWLKVAVSDQARNNLNALRHMLGGIKQQEALDRILRGEEEAIEMLKTIAEKSSKLIENDGK